MRPIALNVARALALTSGLFAGGGSRLASAEDAAGNAAKSPRLRARLPNLQPPKAAPARVPRRGDTDTAGTTVKPIQGKGETTVSPLDAPPPQGIIIDLRNDTEFIFPDKKKAGPADLKV